MALIIVRHYVRRPVGDAQRYLSQLAASGGMMLVRLGLSDGGSRAYPVLIGERPLQADGGRSWWSVWNGRLDVPGASGAVTVRADGENAVLEFFVTYTTADDGAVTLRDGFAFRRASSLARAYLGALDEGILATAVVAA